MASTSAPGVSTSVGTRLDWFGTVRGRVGYLVTPTALFYATGGWAYGRVTSSASATAAGLAAGSSISSTQTGGWTAGAGLEYAISPRVSFKTEYLFVNLGNANLSNGVSGGVPFSLSEKTTVHTVKAGLNFKIGSWGGWGL
jgi:outer membrane immunogenic protein